MSRLLTDIYSVWWADLRLIRHLWLRFVLTSIISPLLYLIAFGYGLGRGMEVEGTSYLNFVIPGIIAITAMNISFNYAGNKLNVDRLFYKSFDELLMAPVSPLALVIGKSLIGVLRGVIVAMFFIILGTFIADISLDYQFVLTLLATCFTFSFLGIVAALLAKSHQDMSTFSSLILLPMTFLGGTFFSVSQLPAPLQAILYLIPVTYSSSCLRAAALARDFPWMSLLALTGFMAVFFVACLWVLRRSSI